MAADLTLLLREAGDGDPEAAERLYTKLYAELRQLARSRVRDAGAMTLLDTTSLVHESFLRLKMQDMPAFADRKHFFAYAARAMRSVVVDLVRTRQTQRRGGGIEHVPLDTQHVEQIGAQDEELLRVHEALDSLAAVDPRQAQVVELRYFGGLSEAEIAAGLGVTERTVQRDWQKARLFLAMSLRA
ncbi:sigma-70 family RNA polymerase sigma factor [Piscinibacter sp. Jin2]|uniref:Sigma-70 family RNA polymerase sigma factor n=1 Tax=Aquariibacter lacus TaxID=2801332 RepID=A0A9X0XGA4_9BURK|nr:ECF-type sigma factor [Piscinibacter lacus]MBL0718985.1 sigma-70 family RNA polymerase sigma factor [Piscinibacter lacus]